MRLTKWINGQIHKQNDEQEFDMWEIDVIKKLTAYEDAEEQGRLVILPCKVGDMVYYRRGRDIIGDTVDRIIIDNGTRYVELNCGRKTFWLEEFGTRVFTSYAEAEAALKGEKA